jgi:hypothetical protein
MGRCSLVETGSSAEAVRQHRTSSFGLVEEGVRAFNVSAVSSQVSTQESCCQRLSKVGSLGLDSHGDPMSELSAALTYVADRVEPRGRRSSISSPIGKRPCEAELYKGATVAVQGRRSPAPLRRMARRISLLRVFEKHPRHPTASELLGAGSCKSIRAHKPDASDCRLEPKMPRTWLTSSAEDRATIAGLLRRGAG